MATAVQSYSTLLRQQIEQTLASRMHARLTLAPRLVREGLQTGYETLDSVLEGGFPVAGTSEIVGSRSSGRATIAAAYLAERTREGNVCAWIDVAGDMSPEACMADGTDLERVLWVRCPGEHSQRSEDHSLAPSSPSPLQAITPQHVPQQSYRKDKSIGTPGVANRPIAAKEVRGVQVASDRQPKRRGAQVLNRDPHLGVPETVQPKPQLVPPGDMTLRKQVTFEDLPRINLPFGKPKRLWGRLEQGVKAVDLLVQAGGFGAIVLDLGGIRAEFARKIPLATWFRWRSALERTRTSLIVLSQMGCAGSSAELMLRVEAEVPAPGTVMQALTYRLEVVRRRFQENTNGRKKQPGRASAWESRIGLGVS